MADHPNGLVDPTPDADAPEGVDGTTGDPVADPVPGAGSGGGRALVLVGLCVAVLLIGATAVHRGWVPNPFGETTEIPSLREAGPRPWVNETPPEDIFFDWTGLTVERSDVRTGGPGIDGIPSLTTAAARHAERPAPQPGGDQINGAHPPVFAEGDALDEVTFPGEFEVVGLVIGGEARAYPVRILTFHECVNDVVGGVPIAVVYCPLCDSFSVLDRRVGEGDDAAVLEFGVSGMLHNSNVLLYDRVEHGLWSQLKMAAISGPRAGQLLSHVGGWSLMTWDAWRAEHPDTSVLTMDTGFEDLPYDMDVYAPYFALSDGGFQPMFPVIHNDDRLVMRTLVAGVLDAEGNATAYPVSLMETPWSIATGAGELRLSAVDGRLRVEAAPEGYRVAQAYWYAWAAAHPGTALIESRDESP